MASRLPPLNALRAFECAARHLSFKTAAAELHVTPTAISHQIRSLEEHLGLRLFERLTRALALTPAGERLLPGVREGLACFTRAVDEASGADAPAQITVLSPPLFSVRWLLPALQGFSARHPDIEYRVVSSLSAIDGHEAARQRGGDTLLASIRFAPGPFPGLRADRLITPAFTPICSPALLRGPHPLRAPADLRHHPLIHDESLAAGEWPAWAEWLAAAGVTGLDASRGPRFSDSALAIDAAIEGLGVALSFRALVHKEIQEGRLLTPFPLSLPSRHAYHLLTPAEGASPALEAFRAWIVERAAEEEGEGAEDEGIRPAL